MTTSPTPGYRRGRRVSDQMTPSLTAYFKRATAAERTGDAARALALHQRIPMFTGGRNVGILRALVQAGEDLPPWVWARWTCYQVLRAEELGGERPLHRRVLDHVLHAIHDDLLSDCYEDGGDPVRVIARVAGDSWAFHQVLTYELGGLDLFLDTVATGRLAEHADLTRRWASTPLGGYRVADSLPGGRLEVYDAATADLIEVLDLGARAGAGEHGWVLGRLVPSSLDDDAPPMFDIAPLAVPERVAREVAAVEGLARWAPVTAALEEGRLGQADLLREDYEILTDVPGLDLLRFGTPPRDLDRVMLQLRAGRDEVLCAAHRILRRARDGDLTELDAPYVAAAILHPGTVEEARRTLARSGDAAIWQRWAARTNEPAARLLGALAQECRDAA